MIFEARGRMFAAMHLAISYYGREVLAHDAIEIRVVGMSVDLKEVRIAGIFIHQGVPQACILL